MAGEKGTRRLGLVPCRREALRSLRVLPSPAAGEGCVGVGTSGCCYMRAEDRGAATPHAITATWEWELGGCKREPWQPPRK